MCACIALAEDFLSGLQLILSLLLFNFLGEFSLQESLQFNVEMLFRGFEDCWLTAHWTLVFVGSLQLNHTSYAEHVIAA